MNACLLYLLGACLFDPSNVYVSGEIDFTPRPYRHSDGSYEGRWCRDRWCTGPVGTFRLGYEADLPNGWRIDLGLKHVSTISTTRDRGTEYPFVAVTYRPFR